MGIAWAQVVRFIRAALGWTQLDLATAVGVTDSAVSDWERGRTFPNQERHRYRVALLWYALSNPDTCPLDADSIGSACRWHLSADWMRLRAWADRQTVIRAVTALFPDVPRLRGERGRP